MAARSGALAAKQTTGAPDELSDRADVDAFQMQLWNVLAKQASLYTMGESTSLPEYDAFRLLRSVCFTLGIEPDEPDPQALRALMHEGVAEAFSRCRAELEIETTRTATLWKEVCLTTPLLESVALTDTLESLRGFGARYDARFFSADIPADIDYPLSHPVDESVQGVRYVNSYLERLLIENSFLQRFDLACCRGVLRAVHPQYGELLINLFEPVAINAIGCALSGCPVEGLSIDDAARKQLSTLLEGNSTARVTKLLETAADDACDALGLRKGAPVEWFAFGRFSVSCVRTYVRRCARDLAPRVLRTHDAPFVAW